LKPLWALFSTLLVVLLGPAHPAFAHGFAGKLIAQGADWRFLNELKKELKA